VLWDPAQRRVRGAAYFLHIYTLICFHMTAHFGIEGIHRTLLDLLVQG